MAHATFIFPAPANAPAASSTGTAGIGSPTCSAKTTAKRTRPPCRIRNCVTSSMSAPQRRSSSVHIEPVIHHAVARDDSGDVVLHVFLQFRGEVARAQVAFPVVPD